MLNSQALSALSLKMSSKCASCGEPCDKSRCTKCGAKDVRICRNLAELGPAFKSDWQLAIKEHKLDKHEFMALAGDRQGSELQKLMQSTLLDKLTTEHSSGLRGNGHWKSAVFLADKYAKEPARLAAIMKNTRSWYDDIGETTLFEDMEYETRQETRTKRQLEESWASNVHDRVKRIKTPIKAEADGDKEGEAKDGESPTKPLSVAQKAWVEKACSNEHFSKRIIESLESTVAEFKNAANAQWTSFLPQHIVTHSEAAIAKVKTVELLISHIGQTGSAANFKQTQQEYKSAIDHAKDNLKRAEAQWELAWSMLSELEQEALLDLTE